jgi:predicted Zn-dependent peptidase
MKTITSFVIALALLVAAPARAAEAPSAIREHTLANGLRILMCEDHKAPVVAVQVWYQVGSKDERPGLTGSSHLLEHMMFQGAAKYGPGEFDRQLVRHGGQNNAFTTADFTAYHEVLASEHLDLAFDLEADRMTGALLPAAKLVSEKEVVKEELRGSSDNSPIGAAWDLLPSLAWLAHPYHWPVGGWVSDLDAVSRDEIVAYYRTYYRPNNALLVVTGDFEPAEAIALAERHFGAIPPVDHIPRNPTKEPDLPGERRAELLRPVSSPVVLAGYRLPAAGHPDLPALTLLASILSRGESSRLHQALVYRGKVAREIDAGLDPGKDGSTFYVAALPMPGVTPARAEAALDAELRRVRTAGVGAAEVAKALVAAEAAQIFGRESAEGLAEAIGQHASLTGDPDPAADLAKLRAVTPADVKRVAVAYLRRANRAVITVRPAGKGDE